MRRGRGGGAAMFFDLNLVESNEDAHAARDRLSMAVRLGYDGAARAHVAADRLRDEDRCYFEWYSRSKRG